MREILINGKPTPIHFGIGAIKEFTADGNHKFADVLEAKIDGSFDAVIRIIYIGLNYGARKVKSDKRYTIEDVEFIVDDDLGILKEVIEIFVESVEVITDRLGDIADMGNSKRLQASPRKPKAPKANQRQ